MNEELPPSTDNPSFASNKPHCCECDGAHEPSGAKSDCIRYWKHLAFQSIQSVEWARTLLYSATPAKMLDEKQSREWCGAFGKWFAEFHSLPVLMDDAGCAKKVCEWLQAGKYRTIMHRHTGTIRALDEVDQKWMEADTLPLLADALMNWETEAFRLNPEWFSATHRIRFGWED